MSEWTDYDDEMHRLGELIAQERTKNKSDQDIKDNENKNQKIEL